MIADGTTSSSLPINRQTALIAVLLWAGSLGDFGNYFGGPGVAISVVAAVAGALLFDAIAPWLAERHARPFIVVVATLVVVGVAFIYPRLNVQTPGHGSDRDDDADIAVRAGLEGRYPFTPRTYLGNSVTHMPGSLLMAAPFVVAGGVALQNTLVVPGVAWLVRRRHGLPSAGFAVGLMAATTGFWHEVVAGGNTPFEWLAITALALYCLDASTSRSRLGRAALLGVAICARANVVTALPVVMVAVWRRSGLRAGVEAGIAAAAAFAALTLPFYLGNSARYTPLTASRHKFAEYATTLPAGDTLLPVIGLTAGVAAGSYLAWRVVQPVVALAAGLAASQIAQFGALSLLSVVAGSRSSALGWASYMALGVVPGAVALGVARAETGGTQRQTRTVP